MALVGENGAGKFTLVKLLCRFHDPDQGRITLDGLDLRDHDLVELRRRFAVVFQDFTRWPLSVADNVGVGAGDGATERGLLDEAARRSGATEVSTAWLRGGRRCWLASSAVSTSPGGSGSGWRWPVPWLDDSGGARPSSSSTNPLLPSTCASRPISTGASPT
jgi:ABC-type phosphate transport system ATPase subunit